MYKMQPFTRSRSHFGDSSRGLGHPERADLTDKQVPRALARRRGRGTCLLLIWSIKKKVRLEQVVYLSWALPVVPMGRAVASFPPSVAVACG